MGNHQYDDLIFYGEVLFMEKKGIVGTQNMRMDKDRLREEYKELEARRKLIQEAQEKAYETEKERIAEQYKEEGKSIEELMADYANGDRYKEYLVHTAILTCDQATVDDFILPNGQKVSLCDRRESRKQGELEVDDNPVSSNGLYYATVRDTIVRYNIPNFLCNCKQAQISREEMINIMKDKDCYKFGVCRHLMKLEERWNNMPMQEGSYMAVTDSYPVGEGVTFEFPTRESKGITMTSVLFCKHGGIIYPITSGQECIEEAGEVIGISKNALRALMELEVLNDYSKGYLVIENGILVGIKPHLVGDGGVTVGFGDRLDDDDLIFYSDPKRSGKINGKLSKNEGDFNNIKDTVIPVDICFEKLIHDTHILYEDAVSDFRNDGVELTQTQVDAIVIAKYQCYSLGKNPFNAIKAGAGRDDLYKHFYDAHDKGSGSFNFTFRTTVEMNIYFDGNYYVEGGLKDIVVEPYENYEK